jgi:hypothetical protein
LILSSLRDFTFLGGEEPSTKVLGYFQRAAQMFVMPLNENEEFQEKHGRAQAKEIRQMGRM